MPRIPASEDDLYSDGAMPEGGSEEEVASETAATTKTALLDKAILGGREFAKGDKVILRIEDILEDEVAVSYPEDEEPVEEGVVEEELVTEDEGMYG